MHWLMKNIGDLTTCTAKRRLRFFGAIMSLQFAFGACAVLLLAATIPTIAQPTFTEPIEMTRSKAEQGDAKAQYKLAVCYSLGQGVDKNPVESLKWMSKAAEQGDTTAQLWVGNAFEAGKIVSQDLTAAAMWYRKAAEQNVGQGQYELGRCYYAGYGVPKDLPQAVEWFKKAAEANMASAQFLLGTCYERGDGVAVDEKEAAKWYRRAADQNVAAAQTALGWCYCRGSGVPLDTTEGVKWYRKAAEQGHNGGQEMLGLCYANGLGIAQNETEAIKWFRKAAAQGNEVAKTELERRKLSLTGDEVRPKAKHGTDWPVKAGGGVIMILYAMMLVGLNNRLTKNLKGWRNGCTTAVLFILAVGGFIGLGHLTSKVSNALYGPVESKTEMSERSMHNAR